MRQYGPIMTRLSSMGRGDKFELREACMESQIHAPRSLQRYFEFQRCRCTRDMAVARYHGIEMLTINRVFNLALQNRQRMFTELLAHNIV